MKREHSVRCHCCPTMVTDLDLSKTEIRAGLREQGWDVAIPLRAVENAANAAEYNAMKGKTVDICPACQQKRMDDAQKIIHQQWADTKLLNMPCSTAVN